MANICDCCLNEVDKLHIMNDGKTRRLYLCFDCLHTNGEVLNRLGFQMKPKNRLTREPKSGIIEK